MPSPLHSSAAITAWKAAVRDFADRDLKAVAREAVHTNTYPEQLGLAIPERGGVRFMCLHLLRAGHRGGTSARVDESGPGHGEPYCDSQTILVASASWSAEEPVSARMSRGEIRRGDLDPMYTLVAGRERG
jgi:hypothetical protein